MAENQIDLKFVADTSQLDKFIRSTKTAENQIKRLADAEAQGKITTQQYDKAVQGIAKQMQSLAKGNIAAWNATNKYSKAVLQAARNNKTLAASADVVTKATVKQGAAVQQVSKKLNQKSMVLQQTGLQLGDLVVQVQSGTGFLLAFGQQATQLIGTFSLLARSTKMIALFSGLGVIVPIATAIAGSLLRMGGDAKTAAERVSELKDSLNAIKNIQAARMAGPTEMFSRFGANAEEAKELLDLQLAIEMARSRRKISDSFGDVKSFSGSFVKEVIDRRTQKTADSGADPQLFAQTLLTEKLNELEGLFEINEDKARDLFAVLEQVFEAKTLEKQKNAGQALKTVLIETGAVFNNLSEEQDEFLSSYIENSITLLGIEKAKTDAAENTFESEQERLRAQRAAIALAQQEVRIVTQAEAAKEAFKSEETSLARKKELLQLEIRFGKESTELREKIQEFERLEYAAGLRKQGLYEGLVRSLVAQREENQGLANEAERVADAAERTERAFSKIASFGSSLSSQIAQAEARVEALKTGQDPGIAGTIAREKARLDELRRENIGSLGADAVFPGEVELVSKIQRLEELLSEQAELTEKLKPKRREARKLGPAGPKLMEDSVKEFFKIGDFEKQIELERELLFVTEDRARVLRQFGLDFAERNPEIIAGLEEQIRATREISQIGGVVQKSFEDGFISIVEGSKSVVGAFKDMARLIIKELFKVLVVQRAVGSFASGGQAGSGILGFLGNAFMSFGTGLSSSAMGGPLHSAGRSSGGTMRANMPYLVGERGPELVMPSHQGSIYNADLTGKAMGGSGKITQVFNFNLSANGDESVKKIVAQAAPQIADMAQKGVIAARRRGGTMRSTFG
jgi:hypothetical protein